MPFCTTAPIVLLDRDGTLIADKHYLADPDQVELLPGVGSSLARLAGQGARFFLVSNQSGIGRGYFPLEAALAVNERLAALLDPFGVRFTDMVFCPHAPQDNCSCRKPKIGLWNALRERYGLDPGHCLMAGDKGEDMAFASAARLALRALVLTGHGRDTAKSLGLNLPEGPYLELVAEPPSPLHPQLLLPSLSHLPRGLELFSLAGGLLCGA